MKTLKLTIITLFISIVAAAQPTIDAEMKALVNYRRMTDKNKTIFKKQRQEQKQKWIDDSIPPQFRIPIEFISYRHASARYYALYNAKHKIGIGYVPSDLAPLYEQEAWRAYKKYGVDAPSLSIVLAQQFTESAFNPYVKGDKGKSIGLPQLYYKTAQMLYRTEKDFWKSFFSFNKKGEQYFYNHRMQVRFPFEFLPKVKEYDANHKLEGLRNYNGSGDEAFAYAEKVIFRSLLYEEQFAKYNEIPLDTANFRENLFSIINLSLLCHELPELPEQKLDQIFKNILSGLSEGEIRKKYTEKYYINVMESDPLSVESDVEFTVPASEKDFYLLIEDGQVLYNYFADNQQMLNAINDPQNSEFYLYYKQGKKIVRINSFKGVGDKKIFSNVKPGDKIYIPPGTVLKAPGSNLSIIVR